MAYLARRSSIPPPYPAPLFFAPSSSVRLIARRGVSGVPLGLFIEGLVTLRLRCFGEVLGEEVICWGNFCLGTAAVEVGGWSFSGRGVWEGEEEACVFVCVCAGWELGEGGR